MTELGSESRLEETGVYASTMRGALGPLDWSYDTMSAIESNSTAVAARLNVSENGSPPDVRPGDVR